MSEDSFDCIVPRSSSRLEEGALFLLLLSSGMCIAPSRPVEVSHRSLINGDRRLKHIPGRHPSRYVIHCPRGDFYCRTITDPSCQDYLGPGSDRRGDIFETYRKSAYAGTLKGGTWYVFYVRDSRRSWYIITIPASNSNDLHSTILRKAYHRSSTVCSTVHPRQVILSDNPQL